MNKNEIELLESIFSKNKTDNKQDILVKKVLKQIPIYVINFPKQLNLNKNLMKKFKIMGILFNTGQLDNDWKFYIFGIDKNNDGFYMITIDIDETKFKNSQMKDDKRFFMQMNSILFTPKDSQFKSFVDTILLDDDYLEYYILPQEETELELDTTKQNSQIAIKVLSQIKKQNNQSGGIIKVNFKIK